MIHLSISGNTQDRIDIQRKCDVLKKDKVWTKAPVRIKDFILLMNQRRAKYIEYSDNEGPDQPVHWH